MTLPLDKLKKGDLVIVSEDLDTEEPQGFSEMPFFAMRRKARFDGKPWKVLAINLPFVLVTDGDHTTAIDVRLWGLIPASKEYVKAWEEDHGVVHRQESIVRGRPVKGRQGGIAPKRRKKEKPDPRACPRCRAKMKERLYEPGSGRWRLICPACGFEGPETTSP